MVEEISNKERFTSNGIKNTRQRSKIFDILKQQEFPTTAEEIYLKLKQVDTAISLSTVYRILDVFVSKGLALKNNISEDNKAMFELNRMEHKHHLICVCCKKILVVDQCPLEVYEKKLEKKTRFDITGHKLEIFGYCPECRQKE